jgi:hypothetical protein
MTIKILSLAMSPGLGSSFETFCYNPKMLVYPFYM